MPNLKLTYFDIRGGRGEPARLASVAFEDDRISFQEFGARRASYPFMRLEHSEFKGPLRAARHAT